MALSICRLCALLRFQSASLRLVGYFLIFFLRVWSRPICCCLSNAKNLLSGLWWIAIFSAWFSFSFSVSLMIIAVVVAVVAVLWCLAYYSCYVWQTPQSAAHMCCCCSCCGEFKLETKSKAKCRVRVEKQKPRAKITYKQRPIARKKKSLLLLLR